MKNLFITILFSLVVLSCSRLPVSLNISAHNPVSDAYWNEISFAAIENNSSIFDVLEENNPALYNQILTDSKDPYLPMFWGQSLNFDSGAKKIIVDHNIMADLQGLFGIKNDNQIVHAGIIHSYGYLFSTILTPYGYKRKRWIAPTLNYAFGLSANSLSPEALEGGLFSNITYFAGSLVFKDKTQLNLLKNVSKEIFTFDYSKLKLDRVEEIIKEYTLVTTLVKLPLKKSGEENDYLLIYSTIDHRLGKELLVTAFPVTQDSYQKIVAPETLGSNQKITIRYNAYLAGVAQSEIGTRKLIKN